MELKRRLARGVAIVSVAVAAGHFVQSVSHNEVTTADEPAPVLPAPTGVKPVSAGPEVAQTEAVKPPLTVDVTPQPSEGFSALTAEETPIQPLPEVSAPSEPTETDSAEAAPVQRDCAPALGLTAAAGGVVDIVLTAPCHADQRVVLSHAGLVITARTSASGTVITRLPALAAAAEISAKFGDGSHVAASIPVPEAASLQRFAVQWQGSEGFRIHALESGAGYGQPGDISAENPRIPVSGVSGLDTRADSGFLMALGDNTVDLPLLAEVYTWPARSGTRVDVLVEAGVTPVTCNSDLLGETLNTMGGQTWITELTVAIPGCDAVGDYLVLKNLVLDPKLAAAN